MGGRVCHICFALLHICFALLHMVLVGAVNIQHRLPPALCACSGTSCVCSKESCRLDLLVDTHMHSSAVAAAFVACSGTNQAFRMAAHHLRSLQESRRLQLLVDTHMHSPAFAACCLLLAVVLAVFAARSLAAWSFWLTPTCIHLRWLPAFVACSGTSRVSQLVVLDLCCVQGVTALGTAGVP